MRDPEGLYDHSRGGEDNRLWGDTGDRILHGLQAAGRAPSTLREKWVARREHAAGRSEREKARQALEARARGGEDEAAPSPEPRRRGDARRGGPRKQGRRRGLAWAGDIVVTVGVILGLFVFWEVGWSNVQSDRLQSGVSDQLAEQWASAGGVSTDGVADSTSRPGSGDPFARIHAPALGDGFTRTVLEGTDQDALAAGPGHYTGSQGAGDNGNFALAGHRDGQGAPFHDLDAFNSCDAIVIETQTRWLTYRVTPFDVSDEGDKTGAEVYQDTASECTDWRTAATLGGAEYGSPQGRSVTTPDDVDVVAPVPGNAEVAVEDAELSMLTLTTCHPLWSNAERLIIHAVLTETEMKGAHDDGWVPEVLT